MVHLSRDEYTSINASWYGIFGLTLDGHNQGSNNLLFNHLFCFITFVDVSTGHDTQLIHQSLLFWSWFYWFLFDEFFQLPKLTQTLNSLVLSNLFYQILAFLDSGGFFFLFTVLVCFRLYSLLFLLFCSYLIRTWRWIRVWSILITLALWTTRVVRFV